VFSGDNPSVRILPGQPVAVIVLQMDGADDLDTALAFLAHELVHCLHLHGGEYRPPMIEEGAAVRFSIMEAVRRNIAFAVTLWHHQTTGPDAEHYAEALAAVEQLLAIEPEAIRRLRTENADWSAITAERILAVAPACPPELAAVLAEVREMRTDDDHAVALARAVEREGRA
jgi:DNA-directed RNA polymerase subunit F